MRGTLITTDGRVYTFEDGEWLDDRMNRSPLIDDESHVLAFMWSATDAKGTWHNVVPVTSISRIAILVEGVD